MRHGIATKPEWHPSIDKSIIIGKVLKFRSDNGEEYFIKVTKILDDGIEFDVISDDVMSKV